MYTSDKGKKEILELYDQKLASLNIDYECIELTGSFGRTNVIATGNPDAPPLVIVHGSNACAPISLETYPSLSKKFRVFAVDIIGQPNKSDDRQLNMKSDEHGRWLNEVIDALRIDNVTLVGFSLGGLVILKTLVSDESKIKEVFLASPAYIVNGNPIKGLIKFFWPMKRYMKTKRVSYIEKFLAELFTDRDEFAVNFLSKVFLHFKMDFTPVPVIQNSEAAKIKTPITLFAAKHDLVFPGEKMLKRARKIFPSLKHALLLEHSKHVQGRTDNTIIEEHILKQSF